MTTPKRLALEAWEQATRDAPAPAGVPIPRQTGDPAARRGHRTRRGLGRAQPAAPWPVLPRGAMPPANSGASRPPSVATPTAGGWAMRIDAFAIAVWVFAVHYDGLKLTSSRKQEPSAYSRSETYHNA